jgi:hypothetical protein
MGGAAPDVVAQGILEALTSPASDLHDAKMEARIGAVVFFIDGGVDCVGQ